MLERSQQTSASSVTLGDVAEFIRGVTFKPEDILSDEVSGGILCFRTKNVQKSLDLSDVWRVPTSVMKRKNQAVSTGDILVSSANSWNLIGKCSWIPPLERIATFGGFVSVLRTTSPHADARYIYHWFSSDPVQAKVRSLGRKTTNISNLDLQRCLDLDLRLPSLPEQIRIAAILDQAEAVRTKRRETLTKLDGMARAIFLEMFGSPLTNQKGWRQVRIGDIANVITGNTPSREISDYYGTHIEWIKSDNINTGSYYATVADEYLSLAGQRVARTAPPNSILVTCIAGSPESIGNAAMIDRRVSFNQQINAIVPISGNVHFLYAQVRVGKKLIQEASTGGMKGLVSKSRFEDVRFIFPPLEMQEKFAHQIVALSCQRDKVRSSLTGTDFLFSSLQHRAFSGDL
jgi:type I restriction enzyme S subunit